MLTFQHLPVEHQRLMLKIVRHIEHVETMIEQRNYGLAAESLDDLKRHDLPVDRGPYVDWPALEAVTS